MYLIRRPTELLSEWLKKKSTIFSVSTRSCCPPSVMLKDAFRGDQKSKSCFHHGANRSLVNPHVSLYDPDRNHGGWCNLFSATVTAGWFNSNNEDVTFPLMIYFYPVNRENNDNRIIANHIIAHLEEINDVSFSETVLKDLKNLKYNLK